jgi:hypothetical protein
MKQSFPGGFFYGLPEMYFDFAFLWHFSGNLGKDFGSGLKQVQEIQRRTFWVTELVMDRMVGSYGLDHLGWVTGL